MSQMPAENKEVLVQLLLQNVKMTGFCPVELWGQDHAALLLYVETCAVDRLGVLNFKHMNTTEHYPSRLKDGLQVSGHNDLSIIADFEYFGVLQYRNGKVTLTDLGWALAGRLRRNRAEGVPDAEFDFTPVLEAKSSGDDKESTAT